MHVVRLVPILALAATASAQLPPSALRPQQPGQTAPAEPGRPGTVPQVPSIPSKPAVPAVPAPVPAEPDTPVRPEKTDTSNAVPNTLTPEEIAQGWKLLFDGQRLIGLRGIQRSDPISSGWKVIGGELVLPKEIKDMDRVTGGDLITMTQYWDFEFRFEWKSSVSSNSGIRYLVSSTPGQSPSGLEYQIIDDVHSPLGLKGGPLRRSGALDNVIPVGSNAVLRTADPLARKGDPWNEGRIVVQGNTVQHWMNGEKACEFQLGPQLRQLAEKNRDRDDKSPRPHALFGMKTKTPIVILDEGTEVAFRNLKIRPLAPQAVSPAPSASGSATKPAGTRPANVPNPFLLPPKNNAQR